MKKVFVEISLPEDGRKIKSLASDKEVVIRIRNSKGVVVKEYVAKP